MAKVFKLGIAANNNQPIEEVNSIEVLANKICDVIMINFRVLACKVTICKPDIHMNGVLDSIEVEVIRDR